MSIIDIFTFSCSNCGDLIPDRDLERLAMIRVEGSKLRIVCPDCIAKEVKDKEVNKRRQSMVVLTTV